MIHYIDFIKRIDDGYFNHVKNESKEKQFNVIRTEFLSSVYPKDYRKAELDEIVSWVIKTHF